MAPCTYALPQTPLWWVKGEPECITWSPQYVTNRRGLSKTSLRPGRGGGNDAEGAETHTGGRFHFLHISQRLFAHPCWTQSRAREGFTPWEIITHNPHGPVSLGSYTHSLKFQMFYHLRFAQAEPQENISVCSELESDLPLHFQLSTIESDIKTSQTLTTTGFENEDSEGRSFKKDRTTTRTNPALIWYVCESVYWALIKWCG